MSLFENPEYRWRETYFVLFPKANRPSNEQVEMRLRSLGNRFQVTGVRANDDGLLESITLVSPLDFAAMDITYLEGDDVVEQVDELRRDLQGALLTPEEQAKCKRLSDCDARFEIFHFERIVDDVEDADGDEYLDPGALLAVLDKLAELCHGVGIDPQSGSVM